MVSSSDITVPSEKQHEYEDALYAYFQNCWHLKDWIKNDDATPATLKTAVQRVDNEQHRIDSLMLSADIANGSKHLKLTRSIRRGAKTEAEIMVRVFDSVSESTQSNASVGFRYQIVESNGNSHDALDLARRALADWENLIASNGGTI
jgi:hypothetical protein